MPLKKSDIARFKKRLEEMKAQLTQIVRGTTEDMKSIQEVKGYSQHQADEGTDDFVRTVNLELTNQECNIIKQIDRALEKIVDNTYGICDVSGEEIPLARLEAIPYANMTVKSQEMIEKGLL